MLFFFVQSETMQVQFCLAVWNDLWKFKLQVAPKQTDPDPKTLILGFILITTTILADIFAFVVFEKHTHVMMCALKNIFLL